ncbi:MAG: dTDP-4-dehydrorhamnose 3,5-epimerase [Thermoplasmatota archaeon]
MKFTPTSLAGVWLLDLERLDDERGFFARSWDPEEFRRLGLDPTIAQCNISFNRRRGTLRGLHFQAEPHPDPKLVRCTRGAIHDVALDLRPASPTYGLSFAATLSADNRRAMFIPAGVAHGFQTLADDTEVAYQMGAPFVPELARGVRWNDAAFGISWPLPDPILSDRDRGFPDHR